jgi:aromatic-L-amino-acid decarboxylase
MLSTVCFRHIPRGMSEDQLNPHNQRLARAMQRDGRIFLAPAIVDGHTCLRACFVNFRTTAEAVALVLDVAAELGDALGGEEDPTAP